MERLTEITPEYVEFTPNHANKKHGILYISEKYEIAIHLCACGCGVECVTPINTPGEWVLTKNEQGKVSITPSIGNWSGENPYHAHYHITENKIIWS